MNNILYETVPKWKSSYGREVRCFYTSSDALRSLLIRKITDFNLAHSDSMKKEIFSLSYNFAFIIENDAYILAATDKIRSYPIFYCKSDSEFYISNSAWLLQKKLKKTEKNDVSIIEMRSAGYVSGRDTLVKNMYQLLPGEILIYDKKSKQLIKDRYFLFFSESISSLSQESLIRNLGQITDKIFSRIIDDSRDRPIWVPLSGGLDSRLILCKLKELGYKNLQTFSYGPAGNHDAKWAKYVADKLNVQWLFIPYQRKDIKKYFWSEERKQYWHCSDQLCAQPFMQDAYALHYLREHGLLSDESIIINGQTGDFISGGHVHGQHFPYLDAQKRYSLDLVKDAIIKKHYNLINTLSIQDMEKITNKISSLLDLSNEQRDRNALMKLYELWEWQERQCKYVINGQRIYDFFGYDWYLPLWDNEYLFFWKEIDYENKINQNLYKAYLDHYDYCGLFKSFKPIIWNWQGGSMLTLPVARMLKIVFGETASKNFYKLCNYWGRYSHHYAPFGFMHHYANYLNFNKPLAYYVDQWFQEHIDLTE